jgi:hypothetical protein
MPAIGQAPNATGETRISVRPNGRRSMVIDKLASQRRDAAIAK